MRNSILLFVLLIFSCNTEDLKAPAYIQWVENENNGLRVSHQIEGLSYTLQYRPHDYIILKESQDGTIKPRELENAMKDLGGLQYYLLRIEGIDYTGDILKYKIQSQDQYYQRQLYLFSEMQRDLKIVDGMDTVYCVLYHQERNYNLAPYNDILLGFDSKGENRFNKKTLLFEDKLFGSGSIQMTIESSAIRNKPNLRL